jgi:hypothetical protein
MDERHANPTVYDKRPREPMPLDDGLSRRLHVVGWREHQILVAEGRYRCPDCCRVDATEAGAAHAPRL